ncbi:MAG TPA: MFS transporter, partial [Devosia sp.]|nr:MFS transporter [Devosia sp.]
AADSVDLEWKPRAISFVLFGGVMAGFLGPRLCYMYKDLIAGHEFAGSYLVISAMAALAMLMIGFTRLAPVPHPEPNEDTGRPLRELIRTPSVFVPILTGMASYALMTFVMVAAPLAMVRICGHPVDSATTAIQWHIVAMFAPSFITGFVINRIGAHLTVGIGLTLILASAAVSLEGISVWHFYAALVLLGAGWNFGFIGSTTLLSESYGPLEAARVQGMNEQLVFGTMAVASIGSGALLQLIGWKAVNVLVVPIASAAIALLAWGYGRSRRERRAASEVG